ncbi:type I-C CRISPR-associated protein Cas5c [Anatilimnocola floriformis]|uniref:type I-C CRISPR-associated protein Cas5c n=1 Tax=Anatilimnocola floriformis TaxID=2948575 RepID=UPI0020C1FD82|nr:type I-C CRISPR-associated protein Cas5c [Anatilimnocola floriformis]
MAKGIRLHVWAEYALFSRPEMKVERVSYDVITPSAARGVIEAIHWKPAIRWRINRIHVLNEIRFTSLRRNEVASKIPRANVAKAMKAGRGALAQFIEEDRQQRAATILRDVAYVIEASFDIVDPQDHPGKHLDQFNRRARAGNCFHRPYLGTREFPCHFALIEPDEELPTSFYTKESSRDLGWMLHDIDFVADEKGGVIASHNDQRFRAEPRFFRATLKHGVIDVPALTPEEVVA